jgi:hypothetical protein
MKHHKVKDQCEQNHHPNSIWMVFCCLAWNIHSFRFLGFTQGQDISFLPKVGWQSAAYAKDEKDNRARTAQLVREKVPSPSNNPVSQTL